jgi:hypothetical protein
MKSAFSNQVAGIRRRAQEKKIGFSFWIGLIMQKKQPTKT